MSEFKILTSLFIILLFSQVCIAQENNSTKKEYWPGLYFNFQSIETKTSTFNLLDSSDFQLQFHSDDFSAKVAFTMPKAPKLVISTTLPNPYVGSPAYDIINTWRNSMNIDVVTGKFYWEW